MVKVRHSFSSRHNRKTKNMRKQKKKYPSIAEKIVEDSDIILEILDSRFIEETRNRELEEKIEKLGKRLIYVMNKSDLAKKKNFNKSPKVSVSCKDRDGIKRLRDMIKREAKKITRKDDEKIAVGVIGYPNTGKSSLINLLIGKSSAGTGSDAGFTKNVQKLRLSEDIVLLDSPGVIPESEYSAIDKEKISKQTMLGGRSYSQVRNPDMVIDTLVKEYPDILDEFYEVDSKGDSEILIEELGKKRGFVKKGGVVDDDKTARVILKDWQTGKIKI
jgi:ribosome biogenesis GTPase A